MSVRASKTALHLYPDTDGTPLESGFVYIGKPGLNPETYPITVYWDIEGTNPAAQPIRTIGGQPSRSGSVGSLFIPGSAYSLTVRDKNGVLVYSDLTVYQGVDLESAAQITTLSELVSAIGADDAQVRLSAGTWVVDDDETIPSNITLEIPRGAVISVASGKTLTINGSISAGLYQWISGAGSVVIFDTEVFPQWWGATIGGIVECASAISSAVTCALAGKSDLTFPGGDYLVSSRVPIDCEGSKKIRVRGAGGVKIVWGGGNDDVVFDLRRWNEKCELAYFTFENTNSATGLTAVRLTTWTGVGVATSGTISNVWIHDITFGQPSLGFNIGLQCGDLTAGYTTEYFTDNCFDRIRFRHCAYGIQIDSTTFDIIYIREFNANGGGVAADGSDANATTHIKSLTVVGKLIIEAMTSNRCTDYSIDLLGGSLFLLGGWFESSGGAFTMASSGAATPSVITNTKFSGAIDASGYSVLYNGSGTLTVTDCEFNIGDLHVFGTQPLVTANNEYIGGAEITRSGGNDVFKRVYERRPLGQAASHWEKISLTYADFSAAAATVTYDIAQDFVNSSFVTACLIRVTTGFTGGAAATAVMDFGTDGTPTGYFEDANVFASAVWRKTAHDDKGSLLYDAAEKSIYHFFDGTDTMRATLTITGDTCDNLTAGAVEIYVLVSSLFAGEDFP